MLFVWEIKLFEFKSLTIMHDKMIIELCLSLLLLRNIK